MRMLSPISGIGRLAMVVGALAISTAALAAGDWPQFRGPNRDGISSETGLLQKWPSEGPKLLWEAAGLGKGFSSIAISGGKILTMGDLKGADGDTQCVVALDLATHMRLWTAKVGPPHADGPRCTPTVSQGLVYAIGTEGDLVCVELATGAERWRKNLQKDLGGFMMSGWKYSESPLVDGERVVCTPGFPSAIVAALDRKTGAILWKCSMPSIGPKGKDGAGYSSIVPATIGGVKQYVQNIGRGIIGVSARDGKFLWGYNRVACDVANITMPIVKGNFVFASNAYNAGSAMFEVTGSGGSFEIREVYFLSANVLQNHHGGLVLLGDYVYGGNGQNAGGPICVEFASGKVAWKDRAVGGGSAAVLAADGCLYFRYENGVMALIKATPAGYSLEGSFQVPQHPAQAWAHPVILDGKMYLRWDDALLCYDVKA